MKRKLAAWTAVGFAAVILVVVVAAVLSSQVGALPRRRMQQQLAAQLGVEIDDYPYQSAFPDGYFYSALKPGMSIQEVHAIVRGYAKVLQCGDYAEIYYYYDTADTSAHRFRLFFDDDGNFEAFQGEDDDSRTIRTDGCAAGLLPGS